jgi:hypothetical protein
MKRKTTFLTTLIAGLAVWLIQSSYSNGFISENYTGSPASNGKCTSCHTNNANQNGVLNVVMADKSNNNPTTKFKVGTTYTIAIAATGGNSQKRGANSTITDKTGKSFGTFNGAVAGQIITANNVKVFTHSPTNPAGIFAYDWTPDASAADTMRIYTTAIVSNSANGNSGDQFLESVTLLTKENTNSSNILPKFILSVYPNPCVNELHFGQNVENGAIINMNGQVVLNFSGTKANTSALPAGKYIVKATSQNFTTTKIVVKMN